MRSDSRIKAACSFCEARGSINLSLKNIIFSTLEEVEVDHLVSFIDEYPSLRQVEFNGCSLSACDSEKLRKVFGALAKRENLSLNLYFNFQLSTSGHLSSANCSLVADYLGSGKFIGVKMERNAALIYKLTEIFQKNSYLKVLDCTNCSLVTIPGDVLMRLCAELEKHPALEYLNLADNALGDDGSDSLSAEELILLASALSKAPRLGILKLDSNELGKFGEEDFKQFVGQLFSNPHLRSIDFSDNDLTPIQMRILFEEVKSHENIVTFKYSEGNGYIESEAVEIERVLVTRALKEYPHLMIKEVPASDSDAGDKNVPEFRSISPVPPGA